MKDLKTYLIENLEFQESHRINEMARMNPPEDNLPYKIEIWVYGENDEQGTKTPHFHVYMENAKIELQIKIKNILNLEIWRSKPKNQTWEGNRKLKKILIEWLQKKAYDTTITNMEAIRQEWNRNNMSNRVSIEEL